MASSIATGITIITDTGLNNAYNRGPITSLFVPPSSCTATATLVNQQADLFVGHYGFSIYHDPSCYPTGANGPSVLASGSVTDWDNYYYSPAVCPSGWNVVGRYPSLAIGPSTTAQLCCPAGYAYREGQHICDSTVTSGQTLVVKSYTSASTTFTLSITTITPTSSTSVRINAIPIMFQASDSAALARATATNDDLSYVIVVF